MARSRRESAQEREWTVRRFRLDEALSERAASRLETAFRGVGWSRCSGDDDWTLDWVQGPPRASDFLELGPGQSINHIPGFAAFGHKGHLHRNVTAARRVAANRADYDFHPRAFSLPEDAEAWAAVVSDEPESVWIAKPPRGGQGRDIAIHSTPRLVPTDGEWVVQEYIDRPHLIDDRKYVLRAWVLVTSLDPLVCYLHHNGVFKMTSRPYRSAADTASDLPRHLTNPSIQSGNPEVPLGSLNSDLHDYRMRLDRLGLDQTRLWGRIRDCVVRSIIACRDQAVAAQQGIEGGQASDGRQTIEGRLDGCFELLGPDILIDEDLKPWVLELNTFPSLEVSEEAEPTAARIVRAAKDEMVRDLVRLIDHDGDPPDRVGGFERAWPAHDAARFTSSFPALRASDRRLAERLNSGLQLDAPGFETRPVEVAPFDEGIAISTADASYVLDGIAAAVWLSLEDGRAPSTIAEDIQRAFPTVNSHRIEADVWDLIARWVRAGLLRPVHPRPTTIDGDKVVVGEAVPPTEAPLTTGGDKHGQREGARTP